MSLNSMIMDESKYNIVFRQLNEEERLIFDDVMHKKVVSPIFKYIYFLEEVLKLITFLF